LNCQQDVLPVFSVLNEKPQDQTPEKTEKLSPEEAANKINATIKEFLHLWDVAEAVQCIQDLGSDEYIPLFFKGVVEKALDAKADIQTKIIEHVKRLLVEMPNVTADRIFEAYTEIMNSVEDLALDIPTIYSTFGQFVGDAIYLNFLNLDGLVDLMAPLINSPGNATSAHVFLGASLRRVLDTEGDQALVKRLESSSLHFSDCWVPSKRQFKLTDFYSLLCPQLEKDVG
jgi:hypothetical protein